MAGFGVLALCSGCAGEGVTGAGPTYRLAIASGDGQVARAGVPLGVPLAVRVSNPEIDAPMPGVRVRFSVAGSDGAARLDDSVGVTDGAGIASARLTPTRANSAFVVEARVAAAPTVAVRFTVTTRASATTTAVQPASARPGDTVFVAGTETAGAAIRVRFGDQSVAALAGSAGNGVRAIVPPCLAPGTIQVALEVDGAPTNSVPLTVTAARTALALAPFEYVTIPAATLGTCLALEGRGNTYLVTAQFASVPADPEMTTEWRLGADGGTAVAMQANSGATDLAARARAPARALRDEFDAALRRLEVPPAAIQGTPAPASVTGPAPAAAPPAAGSLREFSVVAKTDGSSFRRVTARLRYAGDRLLAYADTTDNAFGSDALVALARLMDRDLYPAAVNAFGSVPDVDGDGRVIVLFSPVVNALARAEDCFFRGYVKGFFYPPDQLERSAGSNRAEIFHAFVPDPAGKYSCPHTEAEVVRALQPEFLHEMQHLISFNERVLARGGLREETWLGEGLSHVAEELGARVFEQRYPPSLGRSTAEQIFPDSAGPFIAPLLLNAYIFLNTTLQHSLTAYVGAGSLEEHGASWLFVRWLAAQHGDQVLRRLVQGGRTGVANVEAVTGEPFARLFGDFALALFADSLPGFARGSVAARLRFGDRNIRQLMAREATISGFAQPFPVTTFLLRPGGALRSSMRAGTMVYSILPTDAATAAVGLSFTTPALAPLPSSLGAQVGIMRLPP